MEKKNSEQNLRKGERQNLCGLRGRITIAQTRGGHPLPPNADTSRSTSYPMSIRFLRRFHSCTRLRRFGLPSCSAFLCNDVLGWWRTVLTRVSRGWNHRPGQRSGSHRDPSLTGSRPENVNESASAGSRRSFSRDRSARRGSRSRESLSSDHGEQLIHDQLSVHSRYRRSPLAWSTRTSYSHLHFCF